MDAPRRKIITALTPNSEIAESYLDVWGHEKRIDAETRAALASALGPARKPAKVKLAGGRCYEPELLAQGARVWGFTVQLYGLRSKRNWGIGDFGDLRTLVELAAARGAGVIGVNPLHATQGSPYSPSSRLAVNFLYLDVEALPEYARSRGAQRLVRTKAFQRKLGELRRAPLVDYAGVSLLKLHALRLVFRDIKPATGAPSTFAIFEALREKHGGGWDRWPREYRDPQSRAVKRFARANAGRVAFHEWLQRAPRAGDRRGSRHRVGRAAREASADRAPLLPPALLREDARGRARAAPGLPARRAHLRQHARPADLAGLLGRARSRLARPRRPDGRQGEGARAARCRAREA